MRPSNLKRLPNFSCDHGDFGRILIDDAPVRRVLQNEKTTSNTEGSRGFTEYPREDSNLQPSAPEADDIIGITRGFPSVVAQMVATDTAENGCERLISLAETDPELARLVSAWPKLSAVVKRMILAALEADQG